MHSVADLRVVSATHINSKYDSTGTILVFYNGTQLHMYLIKEI